RVWVRTAPRAPNWKALCSDWPRERISKSGARGSSIDAADPPDVVSVTVRVIQSSSVIALRSTVASKRTPSSATASAGTSARARITAMRVAASPVLLGIRPPPLPLRAAKERQALLARLQRIENPFRLRGAGRHLLHAGALLPALALFAHRAGGALPGGFPVRALARALVGTVGGDLAFLRGAGRRAVLGAFVLADASFLRLALVLAGAPGLRLARVPFAGLLLPCVLGSLRIGTLLAFLLALLLALALRLGPLLLSLRPEQGLEILAGHRVLRIALERGAEARDGRVEIAARGVRVAEPVQRLPARSAARQRLGEGLGGLVEPPERLQRETAIEVDPTVLRTPPRRAFEVLQRRFGLSRP